jgi:MarR family transcriptional regulator for hemolysin
MSDSLHDRFGERLGEVARLWRVQMNRRLQARGLSVAQWLVLRALARKGDGTVQRDLAEAIGVEGSTLVGLLDRLAKAGLIERREAAHDRRYKSVHLSAAAVDLIPELDAIHRGLRQELYRDIPEQDLATGLEVLERVLARIERLAETSPEGRSAAMAER